MTKPQDFPPETVFGDGDRMPYVRDLGGGAFEDSHMTILNMKANFANPTTLTLPIQVDGKLVDSFITYSTSTQEYTSTKDWVFPGAGVWLSQSLHLHNSGNILGVHDHIAGAEGLAIIRNFDDVSGSEQTVSLLKLEPAEWFIFQPVDTDEKTITGLETIDFVQGVVVPGLAGGSRIKGTEGKVLFNVWVALNPDDDNTLTDQELIDLPAIEKIVVFMGSQDVSTPWDLDNPNILPDTYEQFYRTNININAGRKLIFQYYSADGNDVTLKGEEVALSGFIPYIESYGLESTEQQIFTSLDTVTNTFQGWSSQQIKNTINARTGHDFQQGPADSAVHANAQTILNGATTIFEVKTPYVKENDSLPFGASHFWDPVTNLITPDQIEGQYSARVSFTAETTQIDKFLTVTLSLGGGGDVLDEVNIRLVKAAGVPQPVTVILPYFSDQDTIDDGLDIKITPVGTSVTIYNQAIYNIKTGGKIL